MLKKILVIVLILLVGSFGGCAGRLVPLDEPMEAVEYDPQQPEVWKLPNGLTVLFIEDTELPLVSGTLYMRGGTWWEDLDVLGTSDAMGSQMRSGGAGKLSAEQLDDRLERLAAGIGSGFSREFGTVAFDCLSADLEEVFGLFADVILQPRFEKKRLELWKGQRVEAIRRRIDDPGEVAQISFQQLLFGDTPYGRVADEKDIHRINRQGLIKAHSYFVRPNEAYLAVSGAVSRAKLAKLVDSYFGDWERRRRDLPPRDSIDYVPQPGIYFVELPVEQATLVMGHHGPARLESDYPAVKSFNEIYGAGGFASRLFRRVRTDLGLAYVAYGAILSDFVVGKNLVWIQTKNSSVAEAMSESWKILRDIRQGGDLSADLAEAKQSIQNSFVFKYDSTSKLVNRSALLRLLGYPEDFDTTFVPKVLSVSAEKVRDVALKHWDPAKFVVVVVGNETAYNSLVKLKSYAEGVGDSEFPGELELKKLKFDQKLILG
jgi:zinc protease